MMNVLNKIKFVKLSNWSLKFVEGDYNDFDIVLKGIVGENNIFLPMDSPYTTNNIIRVMKYTSLLCDDDIHVTLESPINESKMERMGFTFEFISCFKYGFPTNWIAILEYFYSQIKAQIDLTLPDKFLEVALRDMNECKNIYLGNAVNIVNWYLKLQSCENEDDFHIILRGHIKEDSGHSIDYIFCEDVVRNRESVDIILCGRSQLYKLITPIDIGKMLEYGYPMELIESFRIGFPSNWFRIWLEFFTQYGNCKEKYMLSNDLTNLEMKEMRTLRSSQTLEVSLYPNYFEECQHSQKKVSINPIELKGEGIIDIESSLPSLLLSGSFKSTNDRICALPETKSSMLTLKESKENSSDLKKLLLNDLSQCHSSISSASFNESSDGCSDFDTSYILPLNLENNNEKTQMTDYFALTENFSSFPEICDGEINIEKQDVDKTFGVFLNNDFDNTIDYCINPEEFFNATLGLTDIENSSRGRFNITSDSLDESIASMYSPKNTVKPPVYYLPAAKHIFKPKNKLKKDKKRVAVESKFDFEKLVYEEIEKKNERNSLGSNETNNSSI